MPRKPVNGDAGNEFVCGVKGVGCGVWGVAGSCIASGAGGIFVHKPECGYTAGGLLSLCR